MMPFEPIFYMGWVIQPTSDGCIVYDRQDHSAAYRTERFQRLREAYNYVNGQIKGGKLDA